MQNFEKSGQPALLVAIACDSSYTLGPNC
uniref:Uncharacterized protein n=1 Tax=Anguilla anguilla TaxID=7936 RepID=A0A0E9Q6F7_ANGAN